MLEKDGNIYEMTKFIVNYNVGMSGVFLNSMEVHGEVGGEEVRFLTTWNFGIAIEEGDYIIAEYEIGKKI